MLLPSLTKGFYTLMRGRTVCTFRPSWKFPAHWQTSRGGSKCRSICSPGSATQTKTLVPPPTSTGSQMSWTNEREQGSCQFRRPNGENCLQNAVPVWTRKWHIQRIQGPDEPPSNASSLLSTLFVLRLFSGFSQEKSLIEVRPCKSFAFLTSTLDDPPCKSSEKDCRSHWIYPLLAQTDEPLVKIRVSRMQTVPSRLDGSGVGRMDVQTTMRDLELCTLNEAVRFHTDTQLRPCSTTPAVPSLQQMVPATVSLQRTGFSHCTKVVPVQSWCTQWLFKTFGYQRSCVIEQELFLLCGNQLLPWWQFWDRTVLEWALVHSALYEQHQRTTVRAALFVQRHPENAILATWSSTCHPCSTSRWCHAHNTAFRREVLSFFTAWMVVQCYPDITESAMQECVTSTCFSVSVQLLPGSSGCNPKMWCLDEPALLSAFSLTRSQMRYHLAEPAGGIWKSQVALGRARDSELNWDWDWEIARATSPRKRASQERRRRDGVAPSGRYNSPKPSGPVPLAEERSAFRGKTQRLAVRHQRCGEYTDGGGRRGWGNAHHGRRAAGHQVLHSCTQSCCFQHSAEGVTLQWPIIGRTTGETGPKPFVSTDAWSTPGVSKPASLTSPLIDRSATQKGSNAWCVSGEPGQREMRHSLRPFNIHSCSSSNPCLSGPARADPLYILPRITNPQGTDRNFGTGAWSEFVGIATPRGVWPLSILYVPQLHYVCACLVHLKLLKIQT